MPTLLAAKCCAFEFNTGARYFVVSIPCTRTQTASPPNTPAEISKTCRVIAPHIRRTAVLAIRGDELELGDVQILLKLELFQHTGSFTAREAFANLLLRDIPAAGIVTASGGNHGAAVAFAAMKLRIPAKSFVPSVASSAKVDLIRQFGADLELIGSCFAEALAASQEWISRTGAIRLIIQGAARWKAFFRHSLRLSAFA